MLRSEARFPLKIDWERVQDLPEWQRGGSLAAIEPPLVCFPLKIDWEATQPRQASTYPAPVRTSRDPGPVDLPSAVQKLAQSASKAGWQVIAQRSTGNVPHGSTGRPTGLKELVALRFGGNLHTARQAYVVYESPAGRSAWKPRSIMIWGPDLTPYAHCSIENLRTFLAEKYMLTEPYLMDWVFDLERARLRSEAVQKRRMTVRRQIVKIADEGRFKASTAEDRQTFRALEDEWKLRVADLQDGVFTSEEVAVMIDPSRRRRASREGLS